LACAALAALPGCHSGSDVTREIEGSPGLAAIADLAPQSLRVHPLTRVEGGPDGRPRLACHIELADRFGHSGKWPLELIIELEGSGEGSRDSAGFKRFSKDLISADDNAASYDWVTRTYVVLLDELPKGAKLSVRASARVPWPDGSVRVLSGNGDVVALAR